MATVAYPALVADPAAVAAAAYTGLGLPVDSDFASKVEAFLEAQRTGARARPPQPCPSPGSPTTRCSSAQR